MGRTANRSTTGTRRRGRPSIYDVARRSGVSVSTVSRHLAGFAGILPATRERISAAIQALAFRPSSLARSLASRSRNSIGLIIAGGSREYSDLFLAEILSGVSAAAAAAGWSVHLTMLAPGPQLAAHLERHADLVDGSLILDIALDLPEVRRFADSGQRLVLINRRSRSFPHVRVDNLEGGRQAATCLAAAGHRRIACLVGSGEIGDERLAGYRAGLGAAGLKPVAVIDCHYLQEDARRAARELLLAPAPPTAYLVASDWMAAGVLDEIRALGRAVPRDVSVVGFDDAIIAETTSPPLTTVHQPLRELGAAAFELFREPDAGPRKTRESRRLAPTLIERESVAAPAE